MNNTTWMSARFIAKESYDEKDTNIVNSSNVDNLRSQKSSKLPKTKVNEYSCKVISS